MFPKMRMQRWRICQKPLRWTPCSREDSRDVLARRLANPGKKKKKPPENPWGRNEGLGDISRRCFKSGKQTPSFTDELTEARLLFCQTLALFFHPKPCRWMCDLDSKLERVNVDQSVWALLKMICFLTHRALSVLDWHTPALMRAEPHGMAWHGYATLSHLFIRKDELWAVSSASLALTWDLSIMSVGRKWQVEPSELGLIAGRSRAIQK